MKTAINLLTLLLLLTFVIFLNTISFETSRENHPPPKSTRVISPSTRSSGTPSSVLQSRAEKLTDEELESAIKSEWSKLRDRTDNREIPTLVSLLRELGRRHALEGLKLIDNLPTPLYLTDILHAHISIIAGWGLVDHEGAAIYLYSDINDPKGPRRWDKFTQDLMRHAFDLAEYEIQSRWVQKDPKGFLVMLDQADSGFPVIPARRREIHHRFPQLPSPFADANPFASGLGSEFPGIRPRFESYYRGALGGERANSLTEWAARNPTTAFEYLEAQKETGAGVFRSDDLDSVALGLSHQFDNYHHLMDVIPESEQIELLQSLVATLDSDPISAPWPVDGRPNPFRFTNRERARDLESFLEENQALPQALRESHLEKVRSFLATE